MRHGAGPSSRSNAFRLRLEALRGDDSARAAELRELLEAYLRLDNRLAKIVAIGDKYQAEALDSSSRLRDALEQLDAIRPAPAKAVPSDDADARPQGAGRSGPGQGEPTARRDAVIERLRAAIEGNGPGAGVDLSDVAVLLRRWEKADARMEKIVSISDRYQSHLRELTHRMDFMARTDPLTGLPNRRDMIERLEREIDRFERYRTPFSVIMFDIDDFKRVNDTFGHEAGDKVLRNVAMVLGKTLRRTDSCSRWGGEEFLVLCPEIGRAEAWLVGEKCRRAVAAERVELPEGSAAVTLSGGVAAIEGGLDMDGVIRVADDALYRAKAAGKDALV